MADDPAGDDFEGDFASALDDAFADAFEDPPAAEDGAAPLDAGVAEEDAQQDDKDAEASGAQEAAEPSGQRIKDEGFMDEDDYDDTLVAEPSGSQQLVDGGAVGVLPKPEYTGPPPAPAALSVSDKDVHRKRVLNTLSEEQLNRYECYRRSSLPRPKMKKLLGTLLGTNSFNDKLVIAMCGITKIFVGHLVETARQLAHEEGHAGALLPRHVRRAYAVLGSRGDVPRKQPPPRRMFR